MSVLRKSNPTVLDLKQLIWAWLVLLPFIALGSFAVRHLLGWRVALWLGIGAAGFAAAIFLLITIGSLGVGYVYEWITTRRSGK